MYKQNNKIFNKIIIILTIIFLILITYIVISHKSNNKSQSLFKAQKLVQLKTNDEVEQWKQDAQILSDEAHKQNQLIVLEGTREILDKYDYTKNEVRYTGSDNKIKWVVNKLNELKTKYITVQTTYSYNFVYDMSSLDVSAENGKVIIKLSRNNVSLKPLAEISSERTISDETHVLSGGFSPQEISSIMYVTQFDTYNQIVNDNKLYEEALHNTEENIRSLADKLGIKDIEFKYFNTETIENDEVQVLD